MTDKGGGKDRGPRPELLPILSSSDSSLKQFGPITTLEVLSDPWATQFYIRAFSDTGWVRVMENGKAKREVGRKGQQVKAVRGAQDWGRKGGASRSPGGQAFRDLTNEEAPWRMTQQLTA